MARISTSGNSSTAQGVGVYLFGPNHWNGEVRSLKTGSKSIRMPRARPDGQAVSTRNDAWPIQVALSLLGELIPQSGLRTVTRPFLSAGTGMLFLSALRRNRVEKTLAKP